ncbi:MAG: amidohydrolase family protein [Thaumarchaeota archaeon]|nr:amidohydrolase family protein [Nitrososphaerota archaeon]
MRALTILEGGNLIDGKGRFIRDAIVVIDDSKIAQAGSAAETKIPPGKNREIELNGMTVMPGLIDVHVHLHGQSDPLTMVSLLSETDAYQATILAENAHRTIEAGFTTVRDMGAPNDVNIDLSRAVNDGILKGPRIIPAATIDMTMVPGDRDIHGLKGGQVTGPAEARKAARMKIACGAEVIQVNATGASFGKYGPKVLILSVEEMRGAIEETHKLGKMSTTHACGSEGIKNAVLAGVQCVEHGQWLYEDDDLIRIMAEQRVGWVPTLMNGFWKLEKIKDEERKGRKSGLPKYVMERAVQMVEPHRKSFEKAMQKGIVIGYGTDVGSPFTPNGMNAYEMEMFVKYGATPMQAIEAATRINAKIIRMDNKIGTVEVGKEADFTIVDGNPLDDVKILQKKENIALVMKGGETVVDRLGLMGPHTGLM